MNCWSEGEISELSGGGGGGGEIEGIVGVRRK